MMLRYPFDFSWRTVWRITTSDYLLVVVLLVLALSLFLAAWLPQTSKQALNNDVQWQAEIQRRFGETAWFGLVRSPLQTLGAFYVTDAIGFRLVLALLALSLLARLVDSLEALKGIWRSNDRVPNPSHPDETGYDTLDGERRTEGTPHSTTVAGSSNQVDQRPWTTLGSFGVWLGALIILAGAVITSLDGWREGALSVTAGARVPLRADTDLFFELRSLDGTGRHGVGAIWRGEDRLVASGDFSVGQPLAGNGVGVYLVGEGPGLRLQAHRTASETLDLVTGPDTVPRKALDLTFTADEARHPVGVPEADLILLLAMSEPNTRTAYPTIQVFEEGSGTYITARDVRDETTFVVDGVTLHLVPIRAAKVRAVRDRGAFWSQLGAVGLLAGLFVSGIGAVRNGSRITGVFPILRGSVTSDDRSTTASDPEKDSAI